MTEYSSAVSNAEGFVLDPRLQNDCLQVMDFPLSRLLLMNDSNYPWFILVPRRAEVRELFELNQADSTQLQHESNLLGRTLMRLFDGQKLNVAALGNIVAQLHIHHIVRFTDDAAWPGPVWGTHPAQPYSEQAAQQLAEQVRSALEEQPLVAGSDFGENLS